jgi:SAM-dependent methyltransferase
MNWSYCESDPALMLFTAARARFGLTLPGDARVLELGCAETNFAERLIQQNPRLEFWGVDARVDRESTGWTYWQGDAANPRLFEDREDGTDAAAGAFDAVIMLGALEHFGLGFYGDPICDEGDCLTMLNVWRWLKPGGWVYFDVPYQPQGFRVAENRHFRMYDDRAVSERLIVPGLREVARAYSEPEPTAGTWIERPTCDKVPYWFVAVHAVKS